MVSCDDCPEAKDMKETIAGSLRARYAKDTVHELLSKCTFLDPRFRVECLEDKEGTLLQLKDEALDIAEVCTIELSEEQHKTAQTPPKKSKGLGAILTKIMVGNQPKAAPLSPGERVDQEVKCYLEMPEVDPLFWWKQHEKKLSIVAKLTRKYLCACGTSVPSERTFSTVGHIVTDHRSRLAPENVNRLVFLAKNLS